MTNLSNPLAQAALAMAKGDTNASPPRLPRIDEKFVIRSSEQLKQAISKQAELGWRSANAEINAALNESLSGRREALLLRKALYDQLGQVAADKVLAKVEKLELADMWGDLTYVVRLKRGIRSGVGKAVKQSNEIDASTMNKWIVSNLVWWLNNKRETQALIDACLSAEKYEHDPA